jgi:NSS family neurotransmitter:Na+ symporter
LVFETLPFIFNQMAASAPVTSSIISIVFFVAILAAALTSAISMLEVGVAFLTEEKGFKRVPATLLLAFLTWLVGIVCSLSFGPLSGTLVLGQTFFDLLDKLCSNWLMPLGGLVFTLFVGWKMRKADVRDELTNGGTCNRVLSRVFYFLIRYVAPVGILAVFFSNLLM